MRGRAEFHKARQLHKSISSVLSMLAPEVAKHLVVQFQGFVQNFFPGWLKYLSTGRSVRSKRGRRQPTRFNQRSSAMRGTQYVRVNKRLKILEII